MKKFLLTVVMLVASLVAVAPAQTTTVNFTSGKSGPCNPLPKRDEHGVLIGYSYYCSAMQITPTGNTTPTNYYSIYFMLPLGSQNFTGGTLYEGHYFVSGVTIPDFTAVNLEGTFDGTVLLATFTATPTQSVSGSIGETFGPVKGTCYRGTCHWNNTILSGSGAFTF